jgi:hypothetical protein
VDTSMRVVVLGAGSRGDQHGALHCSWAGAIEEGRTSKVVVLGICGVVH